MKLIHTSDWHLGHQLYNFDRQDEQELMLRRIEALVGEERPDALLVSGDVYHNSQPSASAQRMFSEAIVRMRDACPSMHIIVTAGNHDSGSRHEVFRSPWEALKVHVLGHPDKEDPARNLIKVGDKGVVAAVPFASARNLPEGFYKLLVDLARREAGELPVVLMAHTTVAGLDWSGHEGASDKCVGGIDALSLDEFGTDYDYAALGHIHKAQWVRGGAGRVRYSGSPLPVSFDEAYRHSVSVVDLAGRGVRPVLREVEIPAVRPLVTLPLHGARPWEEVKELLDGFHPETQGTYLRLMVEVDSFLDAATNAEARRLAESKGCRFCHIQCVRPERAESLLRALSVEEFQRECPEEIAKRYAEDKGVDWDEELSALFKEVVALVEEESRE